jgi:hypothetical protein
MKKENKNTSFIINESKNVQRNIPLSQPFPPGEKGVSKNFSPRPWGDK